MNKKIIVPVIAAAVAMGAVAFGASSVSAQSSEDGYPSIVTKIAERFGINQDDVKAVFDEERASHEQERQQQMEERLTAAVTAGEITEEQKQTIITKQAEMKADRESEMESFKDMTEEERQASMQAQKDEMESKRTELQSWADAQGIDMKYLMMGGGGHGGPRGFHGPDGDESVIESATEVEQE